MISKEEARRELARRELARRRSQGEQPATTETPAEDPSVLSDVVRSIGSGLRRGAESAIGGIGSAGELQAGIASWLARQVGAGPEAQELAGDIGRRFSPMPWAPSTREVQTATDAVAGPSYEPQTAAGEYARTVGEFAPAAIGGPGNLATRAVTQVALPALASEAAGQATEGTSFEPYARVAAGIAGGVTPNLLRRAVTPMPISAERKAMVDTLRREGVELTAGQTTGRRNLQAMEGEVGGTAAANLLERQGEQFTAAALKNAGIDAKRATPEVLREGYENLGRRFDDLAARTTTKFDTQLQDDLLNDVISYQQNATSVAPVVESTVNRISDIAKANGGIIPGAQYQSLRSDIGTAARRTSDNATAAALRDLQESLDDAVQRSMPGDLLPAWQDVRGKYRNFLVIERAATGAGEQAALGIISPARLRQATIGVQGRRNYAMGRGDFDELARAGEATMRPPPQSGTAMRMAARGSPSMMAILGALAGHDAAGLLAGAAGAAAGGAIPGAMGRALVSKPVRDYLSNQVAAGVPTLDPRVAAISSLLLARE